MNEAGNVDQRVKVYLENVDFKKWARVYAPVNRGRIMTSNIVECINKKLKEARELPIIDFLKQTKKLFGTLNYKNNEKVSYTNTSLGKRFEDILHLNISKSSRLNVS